MRVWHRRFGYASNARIIRASKLLTGMGNFNSAYDPTEVYSDLEQSDPDFDEDEHTELGKPEEPAVAGGLSNKDTNSGKPEEPAGAGGLPDKDTNSTTPAHATNHEHSVESARTSTYNVLSSAKASAFVTATESDFDTLCTSCIAASRLVLYYITSR